MMPDIFLVLSRQGKRRYDHKQKGFGGQTKPIFHKKVSPEPLLTTSYDVSQYSRRSSLTSKRRYMLVGWRP